MRCMRLDNETSLELIFLLQSKKYITSYHLHVHTFILKKHLLCSIYRAAVREKGLKKFTRTMVYLYFTQNKLNTSYLCYYKDHVLSQAVIVYNNTVCFNFKVNKNTLMCISVTSRMNVHSNMVTSLSHLSEVLASHCFH